MQLTFFIELKFGEKILRSYNTSKNKIKTKIRMIS